MGVVGIDLETTFMNETGASPYIDGILSIAVNDGNEVYLTDDLDKIEQLLVDPDVVKLLHNGAFDLQFLMYHMFDVQVRNIWDTMIVERMLTAGTGAACDLSATVQRYCDVHLGKDLRQTFMHHRGELTSEQRAYALNDVRYLPAIYEAQRAAIHTRGMDDIVRIENLLVPIVAEMELNGIGFSEEEWNKILIAEQSRLPELEREAQRLLSGSFEMDIFTGQFAGTLNLNSSTQLLRAFQRKGYKIQNTDAHTLSKLTCPEAKAILAYRECTGRLKWDYPKYVNPVTGRIHPDLVQTGASTGRFSCKDPNLQNVPADRMFRGMFISRDGYKLITADYSQQELRVLAECSGDTALQEACLSDVHLATARLIYDEPKMEKSDARRLTAKTALFAMAYGASLRTFAETFGAPVDDVRYEYKRIREVYPKAFGHWGRRSLELLRQNGYTLTLGGRRRYFPGVMEDPGRYMTVAQNSPIQGTSADMMKLALVYISERIRSYDARLLLCVHDETVTEVRASQAEEVAEIIKVAMQDAGAYYVKSVPVPANATIADTWMK